MSNLVVTLAALSARVLPVSIKKTIYRFGPFARLVRNELNRAVPSGLNQTIVAGGELAGMSMILDLQSEKDYWLGTYESDLQAAVREFVRPGMVAYDVGANIGYITLLLADAVEENGLVFAFEALPTNLDRLRENVSLNKLDARVTVVSSAVADRSVRMRFLIGPSGGMGKLERSAGRMDLEYTDSLEVRSICMDDFVFTEKHNPPQVIKMDIEGGEVLALQGMSRLLAYTKPLIFMELHGPEAAHAAWDVLSRSGYSIRRMQPGYPQVFDLDDLDWKAYLIGIPNDD